MITIKEVALLAETSVATVSRVLNGNPHVSESTRKRILEVISSSGYTPQRTSKPDMVRSAILVLLPSLNNPYFQELLRGIEHKASANSMQTYYCVTHRNADVERQYLNELFSKRVRGAITVSSSLECNELDGLADKYPIIQCGSLSLDTQMSYVSIDDRLAAYEGVKYLIKLGHRKIAMFSYNYPHLPFVKNRHDGYLQALKDYHIPYTKEYDIECESGYSDGYSACEHCLSLHDRPSAIFTFNELTALGAIACLKSNNLRIGADIDILGFDGTYLSECATPQLSVIQQPGYDIGRGAFEILEERMNDPEHFINKKMILSFKLIKRGTTRKEPLPESNV
jgi:LacI family repressor for deo operon, udp, cdd, tsx, nupC, and nupG